MVLVYVLCFLCTLMIRIDIATTQGKMMIGIKFRNYTNYDGTTSNGQCCDDVTKSAPNCPLDECDTAFEPCGKRDSVTTCDVFPQALYATTYNKTSFQLADGDKLGNGVNKSSNLNVFRFNYSPKIISFTVKAQEMPEEGQTGTSRPIAAWSIQIDWCDHKYINPPLWRDYLLSDTHAQLGIWVFAQCDKNYYGPTCSVYCPPTTGSAHYNCLDNGTKECDVGWEGANCDIMTDHCPGHQCLNGGTCNNNLTGYTCICAPLYTGQFCGSAIPQTTAATTQASTSTSTPTTTMTTTTTTAPMTTTTTTPTTLTTRVTTTQTSPSSTLSPSPVAVTKITSTPPQATTKDLMTSSTKSLNASPLSLPSSKENSNDDNLLIPIIAGVGGGLLLIASTIGAVYYFKRKNPSKVRLATPQNDGSSHPNNKDEQLHRDNNQDNVSHAWSTPPSSPLPRLYTPPQTVAPNNHKDLPLGLSDF